MRVLMGAFGTRGDVQPMLALTLALQARGHTVTLAVPPSSLQLARGMGLQPLSVGLDYEEVSRRAANGSLRELLSLLPVVRAQLDEQLAGLEAHAAGADLVVGASVFGVGALLSQQPRRPYAYFTFCPQLIPSGDHPSPGFEWFLMPRWLNRFTWVLNSLAWSSVLSRTLRRAFSDRALSWEGNTWRTVLGRRPFVASDPALSLAPRDYEVAITQVGAMFFDDPAELSPEVRAFLSAGPPPVYLGFGSMSDRDPAGTTRRLLEAVRLSGARALVSRGWAGLSADQPPEGVLFVGNEPHGKLFPRCAAVVHHGGAGTTHAAARAGVPQVVMSQLLDQHYWAHHVRRLGIGPGRVARYARTAEPLAAALRQCLTDEAMRQRARTVAASMRTDGLEVAAQHLEHLAHRG